MCTELSTASQDVVNQKKVQGNGILLSISCPLCFIQYLFCSLWKFLLKLQKKKKKSIVQRYVRFFETWNALINRLDEIIFWRSIYFLNPESKKEYTDSIFFVFHCKGAVAMRSHCTTCVILKCISVYKS